MVRKGECVRVHGGIEGCSVCVCVCMHVPIEIHSNSFASVKEFHIIGH